MTYNLELRNGVLMKVGQKQQKDFHLHKYLRTPGMWILVK
jgi:hypothetical protein